MVFGEISDIDDGEAGLSIRSKLNTLIDKSNSIISLREWGGNFYSFLSQADASGENVFDLIIDETINLTGGLTYDIPETASVICTRQAYFQGSGSGEIIDFAYGSNLLVAPDQDLFSDDVSIVGQPSVAPILRGALWSTTTHSGEAGSHTLKPLYKNTMITRAHYEVLTSLTSEGSTTVAFGIETDDPTGLLTAKAHNSGELATGFHDFTPDGDAANFTSKTTASGRGLIITIAGDTLTTGKILLWWEEIYAGDA